MTTVEESSADGELARALSWASAMFKIDDIEHGYLDCYWVSDELVRLTDADSLVVDWDYYSQLDFSFCSNMNKLRNHPAKTIYALLGDKSPPESERELLKGALQLHCGIELIFVADESLAFPGDADFIIHTDFMGEHEGMIEFSHGLLEHLGLIGE